MAITAVSLTPRTHGFAVNASSADLSGCEEVVAAVASKSIVLSQVVISCVAAITVTLGAGETTGAVTAVVLGPVNFAATSGSPYTVKFEPPIQLASATALVADASGAGAVCIFAQGYYE